MNAPAYSSVPTKVLSIDHTFFDFFSIFSFIVNNCNCRIVFRKGFKINIFLLFTIIYSKININVVKTILPQFSAIICLCTLEKTQISLGKSLGKLSSVVANFKDWMWHIFFASSHLFPYIIYSLELYLVQVICKRFYEKNNVNGNQQNVFFHAQVPYPLHQLIYLR